MFPRHQPPLPKYSPFPRTAWAILAASLPVHLALALATDLSPDEAYYLCVARHGSPMVDHPPLVLWMLRLSDRLPGPVELRVRVWALAFAFGVGAACVELARRRGAGREGCLLAAWVGTWALLPTAGGFVTTPDGPVLLAVAMALLILGEATLGWAEGLGAGAFLFLAGLGKVVAAPIGLSLAARSRGPAWIRAAVALGPFVALLVGAPSLRFQLRHAFAATRPLGWSLASAVEALTAAVSAQALLWSPLVLWFGGKALRRLPPADRALTWTLTALVLVSAVVRGVPPEPNWWAPAALVVVVACAQAGEALRRRTRRLVVATVLLPTLIAAAHTVHPFLPLAEGADPTARLHGWSSGREPLRAPGVGPYGPASERCVYRGVCDEFTRLFSNLDVHE